MGERGDGESEGASRREEEEAGGPGVEGEEVDAGPGWGVPLLGEDERMRKSRCLGDGDEEVDEDDDEEEADEEDDEEEVDDDDEEDEEEEETTTGCSTLRVVRL
ncbi:unnamed protein product [Lampetra planeri]